MKFTPFIDILTDVELFDDNAYIIFYSMLSNVILEIKLKKVNL